METRTETVPMGVDPNGLVDIARSLWVEGKYVQAYRLLVDNLDGIDDDHAFEILAGRMTLRAADSIDDCKSALYPIKDNFDPVKRYGQGVNYPAPSMKFLLDRLAEYEKFSQHFEVIKTLGPLAHAAQGLPCGPIFGSEAVGDRMPPNHASPVGYVAHEMVSLTLSRMMPPPTKEEWSAFYKRWGPKIREAMKDKHEAREAERTERRRQRITPIERAVASTPENTPFYAMRDLKGNVDGAIALQMAMDRWPIPDADPSMKPKAGWLSPDGRFYPCIYMGHGWLAFKLVEGSDDLRRRATGKDPERFLETEGWVKLAHTSDEVAMVFCVFGSHLSKPQAAKVVKWCEIHNASLPLSLQSE